jgi:hypothetical protein
MQRNDTRRSILRIRDIKENDAIEYKLPGDRPKADNESQKRRYDKLPTDI